MKLVEGPNRHMLVMAREARGITQSELADLIGVGQGTISKIESGLNEFHSEIVDAAAKALNYKAGLFYESGRPYGMPPFHYRKRKKLGKKHLEKMIGEMNIRRIQLKILLKSANLNTNRFIPEIDRDEYLSGSRKMFSVEAAAQQLREFWMLPSGPVDNVVDLIEDNGGVVISCNFDNELIDAVSQRIDGLPVLFFVNMNAPADRIRHTLCHELAHMVLHTTSFLEDEVMEREADMFAGAFLLPSNQFRHQLSRFDLRQIANMKKHWKVSMSSIAMRADSLNLISPYQKKMFFIEMGKLGYRKHEPHEPAKEYPKTVRKLVDYHINVLNYSLDEIASALYIGVDEFRGMYGFGNFGDHPEGGATRPRLRIVK